MSSSRTLSPKLLSPKTQHFLFRLWMCFKSNEKSSVYNKTHRIDNMYYNYSTTPYCINTGIMCCFLWGSDTFYTKSSLCSIFCNKKNNVFKIVCHLKNQRIGYIMIERTFSQSWHSFQWTNMTLWLNFLWDPWISCE